jgi:hypothetical protein
VNHQPPPMGSVIPASLLLSKDDSTFSFMKSQYMALGVSVFSMLMKEQLFQVTAKIAKRIDSQVLSKYLSYQVCVFSHVNSQSSLLGFKMTFYLKSLCAQNSHILFGSVNIQNI